jgi:hypothetical protein
VSIGQRRLRGFQFFGKVRTTAIFVGLLVGKREVEDRLWFYQFGIEAGIDCGF